MKTSRYIVRNLVIIGIVIILAVILFIVGLMIGYGIIGDGKMSEILKASTWQHIFDFFNTQ